MRPHPGTKIIKLALSPPMIGHHHGAPIADLSDGRDPGRRYVRIPREMRGFAKLGWLMGVFVLAGCGSAARQPRAVHRSADARPSGTLYLANARHPGTVTIVDVARERTQTHRLSELSAGDPPYTLAVIGERVVVYGSDQTSAFDLGLHEPAKRLGEAWFFVPSATPGRVWLALLDPTSPATVRALRAVREVTVDGRTTLAHSARPPQWPLAAVDNGLLVQGKTLEVWQPTSGRVLRKLPGVFALATRHTLAVTCPRRCPALHVTNTRTGRDLRIEPGARFRFIESYDGAFSPDGKLVAVPAITHDGHARVAMVDLARRRATLVRGATLARYYTLMAWSSTGWLFFNVGHRRLAAYRPGADRATLLPVRVQPFVDLAAR
jgi:hypothetical protein